MASRLDPVWAAVDGWRWPVAAPVGLAVGLGVGAGSLAVGGWVGVGFGALAAAAFGWLAAQGEARTEVEEEDPAGLVGRMERWGRERALAVRAVGARWVARLRERAESVRGAVADLVGQTRMTDGASTTWGLREPSPGGGVESDGGRAEPGPSAGEAPDPAGSSPPSAPQGFAVARGPEHVGALVNLTPGPIEVHVQRNPRKAAHDLLELDTVALGEVPAVSARWLTDAQAREAAPWISLATRSESVQWYGPDLPGLPPNLLSKEELADGPPLEPALFARRNRKDPLRAVREPTDAGDTLGPMKDLAGGRLVSDSWPEGIDVAPFRLMTLPVTEALWAEVMGGRRGHWQFGQAPVTLVSWFDAVAFCNRASELAGYTLAYDAEGRWLPEADGYRLPTDAEWECACRAGTTTRFHWGEEAAGAADYAWFDDNAGRRAHAVGRKRPNPWRLYELTGNVWEWCTSAFDGRQVVDNLPAVSTREVARVLRGGSFFDWSRDLRSSLRNSVRPSFENKNVGFRCVRGVRRESVVDP
jgi:sulfatase modifying factor 1